MTEMKFKDYIAEVNKIAEFYIGKVDRDAYVHIKKEISKIYNGYLSNWIFVDGGVTYDTIDSKNIGCMRILKYDIEYKDDYSLDTLDYSWTVSKVEISNELPEEFNNWDVEDIGQGIEYLLAKQRREESLRRIQILQKEIEECKDNVAKYEKIMKYESWDKKMLQRDMEE